MLTCFTIGSVVGIVSPAIASADSAKATTSTVNLRESLIDRPGSTDTEKQSEDRLGLSQYGLSSNDIDSKMSVVQGADGLTYVVANDGETKKGTDSGTIEVAINKKRQTEANNANLGVNSFYDVDYNNVKSLQSALNNKNFPFLSTDAELKANPKNTYEGMINHKKTKSYFAERILALSKNLNDIPSTYTSVSGDERRAVISKVYTTEPDVEQTAKKSRSNGLFGAIASLFGTKASADNINLHRIEPPYGWKWVMHVITSAGSDYTENVAVYRIINGQHAFCIEPGKTATTSYSGSESGLNPAQKARISSYLTAYKEFGGWVQNEDGFKRWIAAQILIWDASPQRPRKVDVTPNWQDGVNRWRNELQARADVIMKAPTWNTQNETVKKGNTANFRVTNANNWGGYNLYIKSVSGGGSASYSNGVVSVDTSHATSNVIKVQIYKGTNPNAFHPTTIWSNSSYQKLVTGDFVTTAELTVHVTDPTGQVSITKKDKLTNKVLSGATFKFSYNNTSKEITTNSNGVALLPDHLREGTRVTVVETRAPDGYTKSNETKTLTVAGNRVETENVTNMPQGQVSIMKIDKLSKEPLAGATFKFSYNDTSKEITTDAKGIALLPDKLDEGARVTVVETRAPDGYTKSSETTTLTVAGGKVVTETVDNMPQGQVSITKIDKLSKEPLAGATFKFSYNNTSKEVTTDAKGIALLPDKLDDGTIVTAVETKAPTGYLLYEKTISLKVDGGKTITTDVSDDRDHGNLALNKNGDLGNSALPNIQFDIYKADGTLYKGNVKTDAKGILMIRDIPIGDYYAIETAGSGGYYASNTKYSFTIKSENWDQDPSKVNVTNMYDLKLHKTVSDMDDSNVTANKWSINKNDFLRYDLSANLQLAGTDHLTQFVLTDNIDSTYVDVSNVQVFATNNSTNNSTNVRTNVTSDFTIDKATSGQVKATLNPAKLTQAASYNVTYTLETTMKVKQSFVDQGGNRSALTIVKNGIATVTKGSQKTLTSNDVTTSLETRKLTVNHVKIDNPNYIFKTDIFTKYVGESYSIPPYDRFDDGNLKYLPTVLAPQTGIVTNNTTLTFKYFNPKLDINADKIMIDTAKAGTSLPVHIDFSKDGDVAFLGEAQWRVDVHDKTNNKNVFSKTFIVKDGVSHDDVKLDASYLKKNTKTEYEFTIVITKTDGGTVTTKTVKLNTFGYTSSEKVITNADADSKNHYDYSAVVRTIKTRKDSKYVELSERVAFDFNNKFKSKTGYGFEVNLAPTYTSEIGDKSNMTMNAIVPDALIDNYLNKGADGYKSSNGLTTIPYANTSTLTNDVSESMKFQFPTVYVESPSGALFNTSQKQNKYSKIKSISNLKDGGHKFYLPIWLKVGQYSNYELKSNTIGRNNIQIDVKANIDAYAQMISTLDSTTKKHDELLIQPVLPTTGNADKKAFGLSDSDWNWLNSHSAK